MVLALVGHDRRRAQPARVAQQRRAEIRDADVPRQAARPGIVERADALGERYARVRPVDEEEVDIGETEATQALFGRALQGALADIVRPDLRDDEHPFARDTGAPEALPDRFLVVVDRGGIDVPVSGREGIRDGGRTGVAAELPRAEADRRNTRATGRNARLFRGLGRADLWP